MDGKLRIRIILAILIAFDANLAMAQNGVIEEIVVTGERRDKNVQDVSASLGVVKGQDIERLGLDDFLSYSRSQPGVVMHQAVKNRSTFNIRGINTDIGDTQLTQEPVAVYINDIAVSQPYASLVQVDLRMYDIERIEVLRGPQGTLFGSGTLGGLVRVLTKQPNPQEFEASLRVDLADVSKAGLRSRYDGMINLPLNDDLTLRAVASVRDEQGWVKNDFLGTENSSDDVSGRAALLWQANDDLSVKAEAIYQNSDPQDGDAWNPDLGVFKRDTVITEQRKTEFTQLNLTVDYEIDDFAHLVSSTNFQTTKSNWFLQVGEIPGIGKLLNQTDPYDTDYFSQELRFVSNRDGRAQWVAGLFYSEVETLDSTINFILNGLLDFVNFVAGPGIINSDDFVRAPTSVTSTEYAAYGDLSYQLNDAWSVTGGIRVFKFKSDYVDHGSYVFDFSTLSPLQLPAFTNRSDDSDITWRALLSYAPDTSQHYYLNLSRGYRVGQVNPNFGPSFVDPTDIIIEPNYASDQSVNYELGAKTNWLDDSLQLNAAIYYIDWEDVQVDALRPSDRRNFIANAGDAKSQGVELELVYLPSDSLDIRLTASWQDAKIDKISPQNSLLSGALVNDELPGTADFLFSSQIDYRWRFGNEFNMAAYLNLQYVGESTNRFSNQAATALANPDFAINQSYENVDAGISMGKDQWDLTFYAENLTDNDNIILDTGAVATASGENHFVTLRPRTLGVRVNYRF